MQILTWKCKIAPLASSWRWQLHWQLHTISKIAPTPTPRWLLQQKLNTLQAHKHSKSVVWDKWEWKGSLIGWRGCFWRENTFTSPPKPLNHSQNPPFCMFQWACLKPAGLGRNRSVWYKPAGSVLNRLVSTSLGEILAKWAIEPGFLASVDQRPC